MILKIVYEEYGFNIEALLIKEAKRLNLTTKELSILLALFSVPAKKRTFSINAISKLVDYDQNEIAEIIENLLEKKFVKTKLEVFNKREREVYNLDGTFKHITNLYEEDIKEQIRLEQTSNIAETIETFEEKIGRMLKSNELERIRTWYETFNFNHNMILNAIKNAKGNITVLYIEKVLNFNYEKPVELDDKTSALLDSIYKKM